MSKQHLKGFGSMKGRYLHKVISASGGRRRVPTKGFGSLTPEQRSENAKRALDIRWHKTRQEKQAMAESEERVVAEQPSDS